jgi:hypothetical protein
MANGPDFFNLDCDLKINRSIWFYTNLASRTKTRDPQSRPNTHLWRHTLGWPRHHRPSGYWLKVPVLSRR